MVRGRLGLRGLLLGSFLLGLLGLLLGRSLLLGVRGRLGLLLRSLSGLSTTLRSIAGLDLQKVLADHDGVLLRSEELGDGTGSGGVDGDINLRTSG